jgi:hypothetical protein
VQACKIEGDCGVWWNHILSIVKADSLGYFVHIPGHHHHGTVQSNGLILSTS